MPPRSWGWWTEQKLDVLADYLAAFTKASKKAGTTVYLDLFAGQALVALLRRDGPQTATQAAAAIGESVASCSFHLRQMAKYGLVELAGGGRGREKPWRATAMFTDVDPADVSDPAVAAAAQAVQLAIAGQYAELLARWLRARPGEPAQWREAASVGDVTLPLTVAELRDLGERMGDLIRPYLDRLGDTAQHPAGSRPVTVVHMAFPTPGPGA